MADRENEKKYSAETKGYTDKIYEVRFMPVLERSERDGRRACRWRAQQSWCLGQVRRAVRRHRHGSPRNMRCCREPLQTAPIVNPCAARYNVPSRTGLNITPETALELSRNPLINGIKEASGNISQVARIAQLCGDELNIYSGNDDQVVPLLSLGGKGVISVVSNVKPELVHNCCKAWFEGDTKTM